MLLRRSESAPVGFLSIPHLKGATMSVPTKELNTEWVYVPCLTGFVRLQAGELIFCPRYNIHAMPAVMDPDEAQDIDWGRIDRTDHARLVALKEVLIQLMERGIPL